MNEFYVYLYLREDNTPYYVGKGKDNRVFSNNRSVSKPKDETRIIFHSKNLTEEEAFTIEKELIAKYGRKDNGTGILRNLTDGGEGTSGAIPGDETKAKMSATAKKRMNNPEVKARHLAAMNSPEVKARILTAAKERMNRPEVKAKLSQNNSMNNPEVKARHLAAMNSPEVKARISKALNKPEVKAKHLAAMNSPEVKAKHLAALKEVMSKPEIRAKISESKKEYYRKKREAKQASANTLTKFFSE
jgi:hypothetical protein